MSSIVSTDMLFLVLPPSPPAEKATACEDQAGESSTGDGRCLLLARLLSDGN
jgi:hypothetical protein